MDEQFMTQGHLTVSQGTQNQGLCHRSSHCRLVKPALIWSRGHNCKKLLFFLFCFFRFAFFNLNELASFKQQYKQNSCYLNRYSHISWLLLQIVVHVTAILLVKTECLLVKVKASVLSRVN